MHKTSRRQFRDSYSTLHVMFSLTNSSIYNRYGFDIETVSLTFSRQLHDSYSTLHMRSSLTYCVYLRLCLCGYSSKRAFWLNFVCVCSRRCKRLPNLVRKRSPHLRMNGLKSLECLNWQGSTSDPIVQIDGLADSSLKRA